MNDQDTVWVIQYIIEDGPSRFFHVAATRELAVRYVEKQHPGIEWRDGVYYAENGEKLTYPIGTTRNYRNQHLAYFIGPLTIIKEVESERA